MSEGSSERRFEMEIDLGADPERVWKALTEAEELMRWFPPSAAVVPGVGGRIEWNWLSEHTWKNVIEVFEPGRHLRLRYDSPVDDGRGGKRPLHMDFHLEGSKGTTRLRLVHHGFGPEADFDAEYDGIRGGWPVELRSLAFYLENHAGRDRRVAWTARRSSATPEAVWKVLVGERGLRAPRLGGLREGDPFAVEVEGIGRISGRTLFVPTPTEFSGVVDELGKAWFRVHCGNWNGTTNVWLWLALYGAGEDNVARIQTAFDRLVERAFESVANGQGGNGS